MASDMAPLEERKLEINVNGIGRFIPALHAEWIMPREWVSYQAPPNPQDLHIPGARETWTDRVDLVLEDLRTLLRCPYHVFWSQLMFDREVLKHLSRLLKRLPRPHDKNFVFPCEIINGKLKEVMSSAFHVFLRMSTFKESKSDFMSSQFYAKLIYDNFIFDVPKIVDICSVFMSGNRKLVTKLVENLLKTQPKYLEDLKHCARPIIEAFMAILSTTEIFFQSRGDISSNEFEDLVLSGVDLSSSIGALFEAFPGSSELFQDSNAEFSVKLAHFYNSVLCVMDEKLTEEVFIKNVDEESANFLITRIYMSKLKIMQVIRTTIMRCILAPVMNQSKDKDDLLELLFHLYTGYLSEASFYQDYMRFHPLDDDIDIFKQLGIEVDPMRIEYLRIGFNVRPVEKEQESMSYEEIGAVGGPAQSNDGACGGPSISEDDVLLDSLISRVRDLFPQLGEGFLLKCLPYFDQDPEKVINALLEDNLPPHLAELDRTMEREKVSPNIPQKTEEVKKQSEEELFIDDMELARIHRGKKKIAKNANALLDDKSELSGLKDKFQAMSIVTDDIYLNPEDAEYDDEYDDTYDENAMGEAEPDAMEARREFVLPRALGGGHKGQQVRIDEESDEDEEEEGKQKLDFARNPEEIRKEAEQRRLSKMARNQKKPQINHARDVVGNPKGQGQDKQVQINRARKNTNKNKNHRAMAERKMAKGMF